MTSPVTGHSEISILVAATLRDDYKYYPTWSHQDELLRRDALFPAKMRVAGKKGITAPASRDPAYLLYNVAKARNVRGVILI